MPETTVKRVKVSELEGAELDYWVAKAEGLKARINLGGPLCEPFCEAICNPEAATYVRFDATTKPGIAMRIIERERISTTAANEAVSGTAWIAHAKYTWPFALERLADGSGPTLLIAAMRAFVRSKFGEEVERE